jgi:hypothetical protein
MQPRGFEAQVKIGAGHVHRGRVVAARDGNRGAGRGRPSSATPRREKRTKLQEPRGVPRCSRTTRRAIVGRAGWNTRTHLAQGMPALPARPARPIRMAVHRLPRPPPVRSADPPVEFISQAISQSSGYRQTTGRIASVQDHFAGVADGRNRIGATFSCARHALACTRRAGRGR